MSCASNVLAFPEPTAEPRTLTIAQAAQDLAVSESWLYHHWGELPHFRVGRTIRFDSSLPRRHMISVIRS
jgi:excisionase family DNA binding protein